MYDTEVLKPSNTGKLIADLDTRHLCLSYGREPKKTPTLLALLADPSVAAYGRISQSLCG